MYIKSIIALTITCLVFSTVVNAQEDEKKGKTKYLSIGPNGVNVDSDKEKAVEMHFGVVDLGLNIIQDKTDYTSAGAQSFLDVDPQLQNENLFDLRGGKSWNVNVWPVLIGWTVGDGDKQKVTLGTGVGLQMYNFRFNKNVTYVNETVPQVYLDTVRTFTKNKLAVTYLSVPLMMNFKTKAGSDNWLIYGVGITGGYRIGSRMKQITAEDGKEKDNNKFNLSDFNSCLTAEFGLEGIFRLFASYQLTAMHENALVQHPISIGIRFGGI